MKASGLMLLLLILLALKGYRSKCRNGGVIINDKPKTPRPDFNPPPQMVTPKPYLVVFDQDSGIDDIVIEVDQADVINRPNNAEDEDLINDHIRHQYGDCDYQIYDLDNIQRVKI